MALRKLDATEMPADAVRLTEDQAMKYHLTLLEKWPDKSDTYAYRYGKYFLAASGFFAGFHINTLFRRKFKLLNYGRFATYLPACIMPASLAVMLHMQLVTNDIVLLKQNVCPICIEMRASTIQALTGAILPTLLVPATSLSLVHRFGTYNIPYITREPRKAVKALLKITSPLKNVLFAIFVGQAILGSTVTYFETKSVYKVHLKLLEMERQHELAQ